MKLEKILMGTGILCLSAMNNLFAQDTASIELANKLVNVVGFTMNDKPTYKYNIDTKINRLNLNIYADKKVSSKKFGEVDLNISKELFVDNKYSVTGHLNFYCFPESNMNNSKEVGLTISKIDSPIGIDLYVGKIIGKNTGNGVFSQLALSKMIKLGDTTTFTPVFMLNHNNNYYTNDSDLSHYSVGASITKKLNDKSEIELGVNMQKSLNNFSSTFSDEIYGGVKVSFNF